MLEFKVIFIAWNEVTAVLLIIGFLSKIKSNIDVLCLYVHNICFVL